MFGSLPASIYFLPKYAALNSIAMIRESFLQSVRFILPVLMAAGTFIYLFSSLIVKLLFSPDFLLIAPVIGFMLIGDFIKVAGYLVVNIMYAKGFMRQLIAVDIVSNLLMLALVSVLFPLFKLHGLTYSYIIANTLIFLYLMFFYCKLNDRLAVNVTNDA
jgi:PST family polysaccharide transporter